MNGMAIYLSLIENDADSALCLMGRHPGALFFFFFEYLGIPNDGLYTPYIEANSEEPMYYRVKGCR